MEKLFYLLFLVFLLLLALLPLNIGRPLAKKLGKLILWILCSPYYLWKWARDNKQATERQKNYELLGRYVALFGNDANIIKYFRNLIESGIKEPDLKKMLEANSHNIENLPIAQAMHQNEQDVKMLAAEQKELLIQSRLSLEQIKFREQLLDDLYKKIRKKYRL